MNKRLKVITINGFRGLMMVVFIVFGLISGFIIAPGWVCMKLWNLFVINHVQVMPMNLYQGVLLWAVIGLSLYLMNNKKTIIGFNTYPRLTPSQIKGIMERANRLGLDTIKNECLNELEFEKNINNNNENKFVQDEAKDKL